MVATDVETLEAALSQALDSEGRLDAMLRVNSSSPPIVLQNPNAAVRKANPPVHAVKDGGWTRDLILTRLDRIYKLAVLDRKWPSAIRALELAGYEFGMFTKRVEVDSYSDEQLQRIAEKAGLTLEQLRDAERFIAAEVLND